jgi:molecular chaperone GrpE
VDATVKEALLDQFRSYLDSIETEAEPAAAPEPESADLYTVFVELAAMRNEVRTESRLVKEALDQFRGVFGTLQSSQAVLEQALKRAQEEGKERARAVLRPLLLELLDLRDRLAAGVAQPAPRAGWLDRWRHPEPEGWREGLAITLRRLDRILADRHVVAIEVIGREFDPAVARVVGTIRDANVAAGTVVEEVRAGFRWEDQLLRAAEVIVKAADDADEENAQ